MMPPFRNHVALGTLVALMVGVVGCTSSDATSSSPPTTQTASRSAGGLYTLDIGTGESSQVLERPEGGDAFALSLDGDRIAFVGKDDAGHRQIFVMNADGTDRRQVTEGSLAATSPSWSPDGTRVAFLGLAPDVTYQIYVVELGSGEVDRVTREPQDVSEAPSWSPDGETIVFQVGDPPVVRSVDIATGDTTTIVNDAGLPDVSPDGSQLAFNTWSMAKVTLADIDGSDRTIIRTPSEMYGAKWSPNGERIVFQSYPAGRAVVYELSTGTRRDAGVWEVVDWLDDQTLLVLV